MKINKEVLKSFNPCIERWKNYLEHYSEFNGSFDKFIDLDKISYQDKIWLASKVLNRNQLVNFGILCAESVLCIFEEKYPEDKRVRDCIEYLISIPDFSNISQETMNEIWKKRRGAAAAAATYAATATAADAAYAAAAAAYAATTADAAYAAAAAYAANAAARTSQQNLSLQFLKMAAST